jgi:hypothetical protein
MDLAAFLSVANHDARPFQLTARQLYRWRAAQNLVADAVPRAGTDNAVDF